MLEDRAGARKNASSSRLQIVFPQIDVNRAVVVGVFSPQLGSLEANAIEVPAHLHALGAEIGKHMRAVILVNHPDATTYITRFACVAERMAVDGSHSIARLKSGGGIRWHRRRGAARQHGSNVFGFEETTADLRAGQFLALAGCQFLKRDQSGF